MSKLWMIPLLMLSAILLAGCSGTRPAPIPVPVETPQPIDVPQALFDQEPEPVLRGDTVGDFGDHYAETKLWGREGWTRLDAACGIVAEHNRRADAAGPDCTGGEGPL